MLQRTDAALLKLGAELEDAWSTQSQLEKDRKAPSSAIEKAYNHTRRIVGRIEATPAHTIEGLRVKARAIVWCHAGDRRLDFGRNLTTDLRLALSIVNDLQSAA